MVSENGGVDVRRPQTWEVWHEGRSFRFLGTRRELSETMKEWNPAWRRIGCLVRRIPAVNPSFDFLRDRSKRRQFNRDAEAYGRWASGETLTPATQ